MNLEELKQKLEKTLNLAVKAHAGQFRKANPDGLQIPYVVHPIRLMELLYNWGLNRPEHLYILQTALLHDVIEDTDMSAEDLLAEGIDEEVISNVVFMTYTGATKEEKAEYLKSFNKANVSVLVSKVGDRILNIMDFMSPDPNYAKKYCFKAADLWDIFDKRKAEVANFLGEKITQRLSSQIQVTRAMAEGEI